jgi:hypothetical protein
MPIQALLTECFFSMLVYQVNILGFSVVESINKGAIEKKEH